MTKYLQQRLVRHLADCHVGPVVLRAIYMECLMYMQGHLVQTWLQWLLTTPSSSMSGRCSGSTIQSWSYIYQFPQESASCRQYAKAVVRRQKAVLTLQQVFAK